RHLHRSHRVAQHWPTQRRCHRGQCRDGCARLRVDRLSMARAVGRGGLNRRGGGEPAREAPGAQSLGRTNPLAVGRVGWCACLARITGLLIADRFRLEGRTKAAFDAIPMSVLTAVIAPTLLTSGAAESIAGVVTVLAAFRLPLLATVAVGVATVVVLRLAFS